MPRSLTNVAISRTGLKVISFGVTSSSNVSPGRSWSEFRTAIGITILPARSIVILLAIMGLYDGNFHVSIPNLYRRSTPRYERRHAGRRCGEPPHGDLGRGRPPFHPGRECVPRGVTSAEDRTASHFLIVNVTIRPSGRGTGRGVEERGLPERLRGRDGVTGGQPYGQPRAPLDREPWLRALALEGVVVCELQVRSLQLG